MCIFLLTISARGSKHFSTSGSIVSKSIGFLRGILVKWLFIRSVVNTSSRHFHILFSDIKYISITPLLIF